MTFLTEIPHSQSRPAFTRGIFPIFSRIATETSRQNLSKKNGRCYVGGGTPVQFIRVFFSLETCLRLSGHQLPEGEQTPQWEQRRLSLVFVSFSPNPSVRLFDATSVCSTGGSLNPGPSPKGTVLRSLRQLFPDFETRSKLVKV